MFSPTAQKKKKKKKGGGGGGRPLSRFPSPYQSYNRGGMGTRAHSHEVAGSFPFASSHLRSSAL